MNVFDTLTQGLGRLVDRGGPAAEPAAVERVVRERFRFLEERQGFELAGSSLLDDGAVAAYANRPAGRSVAVFARRGRGVWAGVGVLDDDGRVPPVNGETLARGLWREVRRVDLDDRRTLTDAIAEAAASLGDRRAA
jgi:hypothetical protein